MGSNGVERYLKDIGFTPEEIDRLKQNNKGRTRMLKREKIDSEEVARKFHEIYERLAPDYGWDTNKETKKSWNDIPESNKQLMIAVSREVLIWLRGKTVKIEGHVDLML